MITLNFNLNNLSEQQVLQLKLFKNIALNSYIQVRKHDTYFNREGFKSKNIVNYFVFSENHIFCFFYNEVKENKTKIDTEEFNNLMFDNFKETLDKKNFIINDSHIFDNGRNSFNIKVDNVNYYFFNDSFYSQEFTLFDEKLFFITVNPQNDDKKEKFNKFIYNLCKNNFIKYKDNKFKLLAVNSDGSDQFIQIIEHFDKKYSNSFMAGLRNFPNKNAYQQQMFIDTNEHLFNLSILDYISNHKKRIRHEYLVNYSVNGITSSLKVEAISKKSVTNLLKQEYSDCVIQEIYLLSKNLEEITQKNDIKVL